MKTRKTAQALTALALAATMTAQVTAFADWTGDDTVTGSFTGTQVSEEQTHSANVTLNADPTYIITIPATISLTDEDNDTIYEGNGKITAEKIHLDEGKKLQVTLTSDFKLQGTIETDVLEYRASTDEDFSSTITSGGIVGDFAANTGDAEDTPLTVYFKTTDKLTFAGNYSDTVTFTFSEVAVGD